MRRMSVPEAVQCRLRMVCHRRRTVPLLRDGIGLPRVAIDVNEKQGIGRRLAYTKGQPRLLNCFPVSTEIGDC